MDMRDKFHFLCPVSRVPRPVSLPLFVNKVGCLILQPGAGVRQLRVILGRG